MTRRSIGLKVTLLDVEPPIWRTFVVPSSASLPALHRVLQIVMGWESCHLHCFRIGEKIYGEPDPWRDDVIPEEGRRLHHFLPSHREIEYEYDFGDGWRHRVEVLQDFAPPGGRELVCLDGARACPPEDCGGAWGYADFLDAIRDPKHERHAELQEWVGGSFDPEAFDRDAVNRELSGGGRARRRR